MGFPLFLLWVFWVTLGFLRVSFDESGGSLLAASGCLWEFLGVWRGHFGPPWSDLGGFGCTLAGHFEPPWVPLGCLGTLWGLFGITLYRSISFHTNKQKVMERCSKTSIWEF